MTQRMGLIRNSLLIIIKGKTKSRLTRLFPTTDDIFKVYFVFNTIKYLNWGVL